MIKPSYGFRCISNSRKVKGDLIKLQVLTSFFCGNSIGCFQLYFNQMHQSDGIISWVRILSLCKDLLSICQLWWKWESFCVTEGTLDLAMESWNWHFWIQEKTHETNTKDEDGGLSLSSLKFAWTPNYQVSKCSACQLVSANKQNLGIVKQHDVPEKDAVLSWHKYEVGRFISLDQFVVNTSGQLQSGYGWADARLQFYGRKIFRDASCGIIWAEKVKPWWLKFILKSGYKSGQQLRSSSSIVIMRSSLIYFDRNARKSDNLRVF